MDTTSVNAMRLPSGDVILKQRLNLATESLVSGAGLLEESGALLLLLVYCRMI